MYNWYERWPVVAQYGFAFVLFLLALIGRFAFGSEPKGPAYVTFYPATVISFYLLGRGPGILVIVLSCLAGEYFFRQSHFGFSTEIRSYVPLFFFVLTSAFIGAVIDALRKANTRVRELSEAVEQSPASVVMTDLDGTILYVNHSFFRVTGFAPEEVIGQNPRILRSGKTPPETYCELWETLKQGRVWSGEFCNKRKDGTEYIESARISSIRGANGKVLRYVAVKEDITEHRENEAALHKLEAETEKMTRFHVARQTVAAIAHELNQPLNALMMYSEVAAKFLTNSAPDREKLDAAIHGITSQAQRAGEVVHSLMDFLQYSEVSLDAVDLNALIRRVVDLVRANHPTAGCVVMYLAQDLPLVQINRMQIEKVLLNLIENALDAVGMLEGAARVAMAVQVRSDKGEMAVVSVHDNGPGIPEGQLDRIFDPFFSTKPNGLGVGLGISRAMVEAHGGELWAESTPGQGSVFHFTLPFVTSHAEAG